MGGSSLHCNCDTIHRDHSSSKYDILSGILTGGTRSHSHHFTNRLQYFEIQYIPSKSISHSLEFHIELYTRSVCVCVFFFLSLFGKKTSWALTPYKKEDKIEAPSTRILQ